MKAEIMGMKASKGTMDNGMAFDSCKVYVKVRLDDSKGNAKGFAMGDYKMGLASEFEKYKHLPFPFMAEVEYDQVTNGKNQTTVITSLVPLEIAGGKPSANRVAA